MAEGVRTITTLMHTYELIQLYVTESLYATIDLPIDTDKITLVADTVMDKISTTKTPAGIVGVFPIPPGPQEPLTSGLVLARITNPGNMGTLIRTAAAMNIKTIVIVEGVDPWSPKVIQATAGSIAYVNIYELNWQELISQKNGLSLCALVVSGGKPPADITFNNTLIVVGNEATGIPETWAADCDQLCTLPMPGKTESLNAAVAGSIAMYALSQQGS